MSQTRQQRAADLRERGGCRVTENALACGTAATQIPSYVTAIPDGTESGVYLAIDLGGTNCRVCSVELFGDSTYTLRQSKHVVPPALRVNTSHRPLFKFIAEQLRDFLAVHYPETPPAVVGRQLQGDNVPPVSNSPPPRRLLGFTFSFTCDQTSLASGTLIHWDKGWDIPEALGRDPCAMLQCAIDELGMPVRVAALANDGVGALLARSYISGVSRSTLASAIFGTGTNAAYVELLSNVTKLHGPHSSEIYNLDEVTVINTEWGCFDNDLEVLPSTRFDEMLDRQSHQPGDQMMEKRVGGLYLGELFRLALLWLLETSEFDMSLPNDSPLFVRESLDTSLLSVLAGAPGTPPAEATAAVAEALRANNVSARDMEAMRIMSSAIVRRAARLAGASLAAILLRSGRMRADEPLPGKEPTVVDEKAIDPPAGSQVELCGLEDCPSWLTLVAQRVVKFIGRPPLASSARPSTESATCPSVSDLKNGIKVQYARSDIDIGVDGSIVECYPGFETEMRQALRDVPEIGDEGEGRITIGLAKDGSSVGAALMALAASKQHIKP